MSTPAVSPLPQGFPGQGFDAQMRQTQGVGFNASNQLVDSHGELVLDASSRPITNPMSNRGTGPGSSAGGFPWGPAAAVATVLGLGWWASR